MCGILGQVGFSGPVDVARLERMRDTMAHRGPDGHGLWVSDDGTAALAHRRLALIDLSESGRQPMANEDGTLQLTFNGEIYNYAELRDELLAAGHVFRSTSDSEVLLHGYEEWGRELLPRLKGMFAFGLYDVARRRLFLARDRFGIKPLYYRHGADAFAFASELKALVEDETVERRLDRRAMVDYLLHRYVPSPATIYQGIAKLPPAHWLELDAGGRATTGRWWELEYGDARPSTEEMLGRFDELLTTSVEQHKVSDVPVGLFLSGGRDSCSLADYCDRIGYPTQAFSIGFADWEDSEHAVAAEVAERFGIPHTVRVLQPSDLTVADDLPFYYDEPLADVSVVPTFAVSRLAAESVKAVMAGDGGDELLGSYGWAARHRQYADAHPLRLRLANALLPPSRGPAVRHYAKGMGKGGFDAAQIRDLVHPDLHDAIPDDVHWLYAASHRRDLTPLKSIQDLDRRLFLGELVLTKVDRASMAHSLEVRVPFLDHELHEYLLGLHEDVYWRPDVIKFALHENVKGRLPPSVTARRKQGFTGPGAFYTNTAWFRERLLDGNLLADGLIQRALVDRQLAKGRHSQLWRVAVLERWYSHWMK